MKLSDFIVLSEQEKTVTVLHQGVLIGKRTENHQRMFLFQLDEFYVETCCNQSSKAVEGFTAFKNLQLLSPYLDAISIVDLIA
jgi:hypothetical protein